MIKVKFIVKLLILGCCCVNAAAQNKTDSVEILIDKYKRTVTSQPDSAFFYIQKATRKAMASQNEFLLANCLYQKGCYYYLVKDNIKSKELLLQAAVLAKKTNNHKVNALANNQIGSLAMDNGNYSESLKRLLEAQKIAEKNNIDYSQCYILNNLGVLYELQGDTLMAIEYYDKNQKLALKNNFKEILLSSYNNIALLIKKSNKPKAILNLNKAYKLAQELNDLNEQFNILINLSFVYLSVHTKENDQKAYNCLLEAQKNVQKTGIEENLFYVKFNFANFYLKQKKYNESIQMYHEALKISAKGINEEQKLKLYSALANVYTMIGDYKQAYSFKEKYDFKKDSIFNIEKNKQFSEIQTAYEVEKKNLKINLLTKEKVIEQGKKRLIVIVGLLLTFLLLLLVFFFRNRSRIQKIVSEKEKEILNQEKRNLIQKQEFKRIQGVVEGQNQERNRIAKEIHDGIGGKLAGLKLELSQVNTTIKNAKINTIIQNFTAVFSEIRVISHNLSSNHINENSLDFLLKELQKEYSDREEFCLGIYIFPEDSLSELDLESKHQLYRILQELLNNIAKHAKAGNVVINITKDENDFSVIVEDDGIGFTDTSKKGIGLHNVKERVMLLNGEMTIDSSGVAGTSIVLKIPNKSNTP